MSFLNFLTTMHSQTGLVLPIYAAILCTAFFLHNIYLLLNTFRACSLGSRTHVWFLYWDSISEQLAWFHESLLFPLIYWLSDGLVSVKEAKSTVGAFPQSSGSTAQWALLGVRPVCKFPVRASVVLSLGNVFEGWWCSCRRSGSVCFGAVKFSSTTQKILVPFKLDRFKYTALLKFYPRRISLHQVERIAKLLFCTS